MSLPIFAATVKWTFLVRQAGGGALLYYENNFPKNNYLKVSLRGGKSNRLGIGARLTAVIGDQRLVRELYPANTFHSQATSTVHFGLGTNERIEKLIVRWPNGGTQEFLDVEGNRHVVIDEATGAIDTVTPGKTIPTVRE